MTYASVSSRFRTLAAAVTLLAIPSTLLAADAGAPGGRRKAATPAAAAPAATGSTSAPGEAGGTAAAGSPLAELRKSNAELKRILQKRSPSWSPEAEAKNADVRRIVGNFLDFEELARRALARHWEGLTPKQRTDFVSTLRALVERSYIRQIHGKPDYDLRLEKENKEGPEATVSGTLNTVARGKKLAIALDYKMISKNGRWVVYDVITDEQSLLENYRAEFNKIIQKESFDALLRRMKKKLDEKPAAE